MNARKIILEVRNMEVSYGGIKIIWGISFQVVEDEIMSIIGSNGAGKTTTIKAVTGLMAPLSGEVHFLEKPIHGSSSSDIVDMGMVHIPEGRQLFPQMSVTENLLMGV